MNEALQDAILDDATVDRLFADVGREAQLVEIVIKGSAERMTGEPTALSLAAARRVLRDRSAFGVQLRYRYGGTEWWDTLIVTGGGVRLVRIDHDAALASAAASCE